VPVSVEKSDGSLAQKLLADFHHAMERVRDRAYELFEQRGRQHGADLDDWWQAERELLVPVKMEMQQEPDRYTCRLAVPGFKPEELNAYVIEGNLVLNGNWTNSTSEPVATEQTRNIFYQFPLPEGARVDRIKATYKQEELTISIPTKAEEKAVPVAINEHKTEENAMASAAA
jgi:HSP20 family molecular chaperone IbpA